VTNPDGSLYAVLGAAGGDSQPQFLLQVLVRLVIGGQDCGDALAAARWSLANRGGGSFNTWTDRGQVRLLLEEHAPAAWRDELARRGHIVEHGPSFDRMFGLAHVITCERGLLAGGTEPRSRFGAVAAF
jgi:gamma-glutamyltranspeptidase